MKPNRMFLAQGKINEIILYCILIDIVAGFIIKKLGGGQHTGAIILLYAFNIAVLAGVYRFWKVPLFEWNTIGFLFYGISPFKKSAGIWKNVEKAGFKSEKNDKGHTKEYFIIIYTDKRGRTVTGVLPMNMVGFADHVKKEIQGFLKERQIKPL